MSYPAAPYPLSSYTRAADFVRLLGERIVILDGAMGTMIQQYKLGEADFRGDRFKEHHKDVLFNHDGHVNKQKLFLTVVYDDTSKMLVSYKAIDTEASMLH